MEPIQLRSYAFRREREAQWLELEQLVERVEGRNLGALSAEELARLPLLYRATLSSLSVARSISLDRNLLVYLERLTARAYFVVYGTKRDFRGPVLEFFRYGFPAIVHHFRWHVLLASLFMVAGLIAGWALVRDDIDRFYSFVPTQYSDGRNPGCPTEKLKNVLYDEEGHTGGELGSFASLLFWNNASVGMYSFSLGFAFGLPVFWLMFHNGLLLGAFAALYESRALGLEFWAWVLPHGVTELLGVILCAAAGLVVGQSVIFPGRHSRLENLSSQGRQAGLMVIGAVCLIFIAGIIEGFFRQLVMSPSVRWVVAVGTGLLWGAYFIPRRGRNQRAAEGSR